MLALETFVNGIMNGHNLLLGIPVMVINLLTIIWLPRVFDYAVQSTSNALYVIRMLVVWCQVLYLLLLCYNSTFPVQKQVRHACTHRRERYVQNIIPHINEIFRTMTIDIQMPNQANNLVIDNVDAENVHDSGVQNSVADAISILKEKTPMLISEADTIKQLKKYIFDEYKGETENKELAYCALRQIDKQNVNILRLNLREKQVLALVWNRINDPVNTDSIDNLKSNLVLELAAAMKTIDEVLCPTGRVNRIVQSLELSDAENIVTLKTDSHMKQEIELLFGPLRQAYLDTLPENDRQKYNMGAAMPTIVENMKQYIDAELRNKYISNGLLSEDKYDTITEELFTELN